MDQPFIMFIDGLMWLAWSIGWFVAARFVEKTRREETLLAKLQHILPTIAGFVLIYFRFTDRLIAPPYPAFITSLVGLAVTALGMLIMVLARIHIGRYWSSTISIKEGHRLIRSGPYRWVRHPIYTGLLTAALGGVVAAQTPTAILGFILLIIAYRLKAFREEKTLLQEFGDDYRRFQRDVPALLPLGAGSESIESPAFQRAVLQSERLRILGVMLVLFILALIACARGFIHPRVGDYIRIPSIIVALALWAAYEGFILWRVSRALKKSVHLPRWVWLINTCVETSLPTLALLSFSTDRWYLGPYRALASPVILLYCVFIVFSTLRLSAGFCVLSGLVAAAGYTTVYAFTLWKYPDDANAAFMPVESFFFYPINLLCVSIIAAVVAAQLRRHVVAALQEAETRRKLDNLEHDLNTARSIQIGLLPKKPPVIPGYDIAGFSQPADQTGGDYYDWMTLSDGRLLFVIADATGHGIGPALLATACRAYFRAVAAHNHPLETVTSQVDSLVTADIPADRFVTAAIATLDPDNHRLRLYSAGHAPLFLFHADSGLVEQLDADQPPLGVGMSDPATTAREYPLLPGDGLILVTDGFSECSNPEGVLLGADRFADAIRRHESLPGDQMIKNLCQEVLTHSAGVPQADDLTAVIIKRRKS